ncbi:D-tagatose-1,6-bisphosphate aldolase subunit [Carex rostrata]
MADASALCVSSASLFPSVRSRSRSNPSSRFFSPQTKTAQLRFAALKSRANSSDAGGVFGDDPYGPYPWESSSESLGSEIQWIQEDIVTLFTSEGLVQIGGSLVPRRFPTSDKRKGKGKSAERHARFQESNYMVPDQGLCLGALFNIAATNGLDMGRRLCIFGFCRSIEMLSDVVEHTVLEHGGEIVAAEKASSEGLQEKLTMKVAVPLLWGVPPASETLRFAVRNGGGIVEKVYWQWDFL